MAVKLKEYTLSPVSARTLHKAVIEDNSFPTALIDSTD